MTSNFNQGNLAQKNTETETDTSNVYTMPQGTPAFGVKGFVPQELRQNLSITAPAIKRKRGRPRLGEKPIAYTPLKALRLGRGITLEELADRAQISPSYLSRLEGGSRRLNAEVITRLSMALSCKPGDLFVGPLTTEGLETPHPELLAGFGGVNNQIVGNMQNPARDLPVYGPRSYGLPGIDGSKGLPVQMNTTNQVELLGQPIEMVGRMGELSEVQSAYGIYVKDKTMDPRYHSGDLLMVNPEKALIPNCYVLVTLFDPLTKKSSLVTARFLGWSPHVLMIEQYVVSDEMAFYGQVVEQSVHDTNTLRGYELHIKRAHVVCVHRIVGCLEQ